MSSIGSPIDTSLVQAAQAQQSASKARDREKAASDRGKRFDDLVELRVAGVEDAEAVKRLPENDSEEAGAEHEAEDHSRPRADGEERPRVDVRA